MWACFRGPQSKCSSVHALLGILLACLISVNAEYDTTPSDTAPGVQWGLTALSVNSLHACIKVASRASIQVYLVVSSECLWCLRTTVLDSKNATRLTNTPHPYVILH